MNITPENYILLALQNYQGNVSYGDTEFDDDLKRLHYIKRLLKRHERNQEISPRLLLNHFIILYNSFGSHATHMLWFRMPELEHLFKPFLELIGRLPERVIINDREILTEDIISDHGILDLLKGI